MVMVAAAVAIAAARALTAVASKDSG